MTYRNPRRLLVALGLATALTAASPARAEATAEQRAAAQALFDDARRLMGEKHYTEACPKLEESQRLDPGLGTLLNLAECQALTGRTASAWANFLEAAFQAKAAGQAKRENTARARAAALEPKLSKLTILAVTSGAKIEIKRDGAPVAASLVGTAVPVDPGEHVVTASAPGKKTWEARVTVRSDAHQVTVSVPQLEDAPASSGPEVKPPPTEVKPPPREDVPPPPSEVKPPAQEVSAGKGLRTAGLVLSVLGFGGLGVAAGFTVMTKLKLDDSNNAGCKGNTCPTQHAYDLRTEARRDGNVATGAWIGGGVVAAGGIGLLIAASVVRNKALATPQAAFLAPAVTIDPWRGGSLGLTGRF